MVDLPDSPAPGLMISAVQVQDRGGAGFTEKQHLDLVSLAHLILFQLRFDLFIPRLALPILGALCTTHFGKLDRRVPW